MAHAILEAISSYALANEIKDEPKYFDTLMRYRADILRWSFRALDEWDRLVAQSGNPVYEEEATYEQRTAASLFRHVTLIALSHHASPATEDIYQDDGGTRLIIRLWLAEDKWTSGGDKRQTLFRSLADMFFSSYSLRFEKQAKDGDRTRQTEFVEMLMEAAGGNMDHVADLALSRLEQAMRSRDVIAVESHSKAIYAILLHPTELTILCPSLFQRRIIRVLTKALRKYLEYRDVSERAMAIAFLRDYIEMLLGSLHLRFQGKIRYFIDSIEGGLIQVSLAILPLLDDLPKIYRDILHRIIGVELVRMLIHQSIFRSLFRALRSISSSAVTELETSALGSAWIAVFQRLLEVTVFHHELSRKMILSGRPHFCSTVSSRLMLSITIVLIRSCIISVVYWFL